MKNKIKKTVRIEIEVEGIYMPEHGPITHNGDVVEPPELEYIDGMSMRVKCGGKWREVDDLSDIEDAVHAAVLTALHDERSE